MSHECKWETVILKRQKKDNNQYLKTYKYQIFISDFVKHHLVHIIMPL